MAFEVILLNEETKTDLSKVDVVLWYDDLDGSRHAEFYESYKLTGNIYMTFYSDDNIATIERLRPSSEYRGKYESDQTIISLRANEQTEELIEHIHRMSAEELITILALNVVAEEI